MRVLRFLISRPAWLRFVQGESENYGSEHEHPIKKIKNGTSSLKTTISVYEKEKALRAPAGPQAHEYELYGVLKPARWKALQNHKYTKTADEPGDDLVNQKQTRQTRA